MPSRPHPKPPLQCHFLKEWREFRNIDQEPAASRLNISRTQLSKIENRKSPYNQRLLEAAAQAYNCTPADLVMRNPLLPDAPYSLYEQLRKAPEPDLKRLQAMVESFLKTGT